MDKNKIDDINQKIRNKGLSQMKDGVQSGLDDITSGVKKGGGKVLASYSLPRKIIFAAALVIVILGIVFIGVSIRKHTANKYLQTGNKYYEKGNFIEAYEYYEKSAKKGNVEAKVKLGDIFFYGKGTAIDHEKAFKTYKSVAKKSGEASFKVYKCYNNGIGVKRNKTRAMKFLKKAIKLDYPPAIAEFEVISGNAENTIKPPPSAKVEDFSPQEILHDEILKGTVPFEKSDTTIDNDEGSEN